MSRVKKRRNPHAKKIGYMVFILAFVGALAVISMGYNMFRSFIDNSTEVESYEKYLLPVVMFDPVPFNTPENAEPTFVLEASMWSALLGENRVNYAYDEFGLLIVPASDVDVEATKLFGSNVKVTHRTFDDYEASYLYDSEIKAYRVPAVSKVSYTPRVEKITKKGDTIILKVGYVPPANIWTTDIQTDKDELQPDKYMTYEIVKDKKKIYHIKSVKDIENVGAPVS